MNPGDPKIDALSEEELPRYFEEHKGDMSLWDTKSARRVRPESVSTVFRLKLAPEELTELWEAARREQLDISDFIRGAALARARSADPPADPA